MLENLPQLEDKPEAKRQRGHKAQLLPMPDNALLQPDPALKVESMLLAQPPNLRKLLHPALPPNKNAHRPAKAALHLGADKIPLQLYPSA